MNEARGLGFRGLLPLVALCCVTGRVSATPPPGWLEVTVQDATSHAKLLGATVHLEPGSHYGYTDQNGLCVINPIQSGSYSMTVIMDQRYETYETTVGVCAYPPKTEVTVDLARLQPDLELTIVSPSAGKVGNTTPVDYRLKFQDMAYTPVKLYVWWWDGQAGRSGMIIDNANFDVNQVPQGEIVSDVWDLPDRTLTLRAQWDTTGLYNATHNLRLAAEFSNPWGANIVLGARPADSSDPGTDGGGGTTTDVANLCFGAVTTSANNPDYFLFDPAEGSDYEHPTVTFEIKDEGQTKDAEDQPYTYEWAVWAVATNSANPQVDYEACVFGERVGPGQVTAYFNDLAEQTANDQQEIGALATWGSFTFEILIEEEQTGDSYWFRWPYDLLIPNTIPGTSTPGHEIYWSETSQHNEVLGYDYYLQDSSGRDASSFQVDCYAPNLASQGTVNNSTQVGIHHQGNPGPEITVFKADPYLMVFRAVDNHGSDGPAWCHREHENKRMLARNGREAGQISDVVWETLPGTDNLPLQPHLGNGQLDTGGGLRVFPGKKSPVDALTPAIAQQRATVLVRVRTERKGAFVVLRAFDVDDRSASTSPIDDEQNWPMAGNSDNRDSTAPAHSFDTGTTEIELKTDSIGEATAEFMVGFQPGDNYRVVACMRDDKDIAVLRARPQDGDAAVYTLGPTGTGPVSQIPDSGPPTKFRSSPVLTVWQRVFYEYDRMWPFSVALAEDAHSGDQEITTSSALFPGMNVVLFDRTGNCEVDRTVVECTPDGPNYRSALDAQLQNDFSIGDAPHAAMYLDGDMEEWLMVADTTLVPQAFREAYVEFEVVASEGWNPNHEALPLSPAYCQVWFGGINNMDNVVWLLGAYRNQVGWFGGSLLSANWSAVYCDHLRSDFPNAPTAIRETTVHELGHQFGLLDWLDRQGLDERCVGGQDGDVMIYDHNVPDPPPPFNPNDFENGVARFGPTNIGGTGGPSIRGCRFPL